MMRNSSSQRILGIDGCPAGWCVFSFWNGQYDFGLYSNLRSFETLLMWSEFAFIDIPIGLADRNVPRDVDKVLRAALSGRRNSVFTPPCRQAVYCDDYPMALELNRRVTGAGVSKQSFHLASKIRQADELLIDVPPLRQILCESHPEYLFSLFNEDQLMEYRKKEHRGIEERLRVLSAIEPSARQLFQIALKQFPRKMVRRDDIADALCLAIGARLANSLRPLFITGSHSTDSHGIPMRIGYFRRFGNWGNTVGL